MRWNDQYRKIEYMALFHSLIFVTKSLQCNAEHFLTAQPYQEVWFLICVSVPLFGNDCVRILVASSSRIGSFLGTPSTRFCGSIVFAVDARITGTARTFPFCAGPLFSSLWSVFYDLSSAKRRFYTLYKESFKSINTIPVTIRTMATQSKHTGQSTLRCPTHRYRPSPDAR